MQKKNLFGILILIAYFASCNQIHKTHYENGWYHILSQQKDSIAKESIVTVKDFVSLRMDSDENGTCVIVGQISKHKLKKWAKETEKAIGKHIAFVLDDTVITNPKVNARIENGVFQISLPHGASVASLRTASSTPGMKLVRSKLSARMVSCSPALPNNTSSWALRPRRRTACT